MFIEVALPLALGALGLAGGKMMKPNDKKVLKKIFQNIRLGVVEDNNIVYPKFKEQKPIFNGDDEVGIVYTFLLPLGISATKLIMAEKENGMVSAGLWKPVELVQEGRWLHVEVYSKGIPKKISYKKLAVKTEGWTVPVGMHYKGILWHDFSLNPHIIIGGTTGYGKTVIMKSIMTYLIESNPEHAKFMIIDLKGALEFWRYRHLEQIQGRIAGNPQEALLLLAKVEAIILERFETFKENNWSNINHTPYKDRLFILVDEAAELIPVNKNDKEKIACQKIMERVAALGRAVGVHLIFGTQYPTSDALPKFIKQNTDTRIGFRLGDPYASEVVLGSKNTQCASLPYKHPGRCIYKADDIFEIQAPYIDDKEIWERLGQYEMEEEDSVDEQAGSDTQESGPIGIPEEESVTTFARFEKRS